MAINPRHERRLARLHPEETREFARWGNYQLSVARTWDPVEGADMERDGEVEVLGGLCVELAHVRAAGGVRVFAKMVYLPDPVMDALCRWWLRQRADESDEAELSGPSTS